MVPEAERFDISSKHSGHVMKVTVRIEFDVDEIDAVPIGRVERTGPMQSVNLGSNVTGFSFSS